ncbi:DUF4259 domain-containing protein [Microbacterium sp. P06]|uniref:DUF4259 domain-containing protein n=1 Tax=Microbacterium sp. P06 TaxID=3366949 RepID=UPI0037450B41
MGAWSGEPFGNDSAGDWAWDLKEQTTWDAVRDALAAVVDTDGPVDSDDATTAIAAAEVVAHGLGRPTQVDGYTADVAAFAMRAGAPGGDVVELAVRALAEATDPEGELAELWEDDPEEWDAANAKLRTALEG